MKTVDALPLGDDAKDALPAVYSEGKAGLRSFMSVFITVVE